MKSEVMFKMTDNCIYQSGFYFYFYSKTYIFIISTFRPQFKHCHVCICIFCLIGHNMLARNIRNINSTNRDSKNCYI